MRVFDVRERLSLAYRIAEPIEDRPHLPEGSTPLGYVGRQTGDLEEAVADARADVELARRGHVGQPHDSAISGLAADLQLGAVLGRAVHFVVVQGILAVVLVQYLGDESSSRAGHLQQGEHVRYITRRRKESPVTILDVDRADPLVQSGVERAKMGGDERVVPKGIGADDLRGNQPAETLTALREPR